MFFIHFLLIIISLIAGAQINYVKVPIAVKNNSNRSIVLDCDYTVRPDDQELILKWYLNDEIVYQWIPPQKPQSLGLLHNKLDLSYKANGDPKTVHRAMKIMNPTIDIAGEYKCMVSTLVDEDFSIKRMIVFDAEESFKITKTFHMEDYVNFTCRASNVYPQPKLTLYEGKRDDYHKKNPLNSFEWSVKKQQSGKFSVYLTSTARTADLYPGSVVYCELRIPGTGYLRRKSFLYYPLDMDTPWNDAGSSTLSQVLVFVFTVFILLQ